MIGEKPNGARDLPPPELTLEERKAQLKEIDAKLFEVALEGKAQVERGATAGDIEVTADFLETLFRRRSSILNEARKVGYTGCDFYGRQTI